MDKVIKLHEVVEEQVRNHSIYVWGASGQLCKDINEKWIRDKESRCDGGKHADDAVASWKAVMNSEYADVARAFDCSGFVSWCLMQIGVLDKRRDCDGLYDRCRPTDKVEDGTLLFRVSEKNPNDETHVGFYFDGLQIHAKGRCFGAVEESYAPAYWAKAGWLKALPKNEPDPEPIIQIKVKGSVRVREGNGVLTRKIVTVRNCYLPYNGQAIEYPYWYMTNVDGRDGYITSNPKYTELV